MAESEPAKLWASVVGDPEPWRKGRVLLGSIALFNALAQSFVFYAILVTGALEGALSLALSFVFWWLIFSFIWFGTHWLRWLLGAFSLLQGFAYLIWGVRDDAPAQLFGGAVSFVVGACLFAPSVHFFAVRQKSEIRWPEKLVVAAVFLLLVGSLALALVGVNLYRGGVQREAERYGARALQRVFGETDTVFLLNEISDPFLQKYSRFGITQLMADTSMRLGPVQNLHTTRCELRSFYRFPMAVAYAGVVDGEGSAACGPVSLRVEVLRFPDGWRINGIWWRCPPGH